MSESPARHVARRSPSLMLACLLLAIAALVAGLAAGWFACIRQGAAGVAAVAVADACCSLSATAALLLAGSLRNTPHAISGILGGTLVRMTAPLAAAAGCKLVAPELFQAGLLGWMVVFFLLTLAIETLLLVGVVSSSRVALGAAWKG